MSEPTSSIVPGKCVVCGKETYTRCSECLKFGTDWMFFCSTEHQRLIFFLHKQVCGIRSNPFRLPPLSQQEIDRIAELIDLPLVEIDSKRVSWAQCAVIASEPPITAKQYRAEFLKRMVATKQPADGSLLPHADNEILLYSRSIAHRLERRLAEDAAQIKFPTLDAYVSESSMTDLTRDLLCNDPIGAFSGFLRRFQLPLPLHASEYSEWSTAFQHKASIRIAMAYKIFANPECMDELEYEFAFDEPLRFCRDVIARTHPREARMMEKVLGKLLGEVVESSSPL